MSASTTNERLKAWVSEWEDDPPARLDHLVRRLGRRVRASLRRSRRCRHLHQARRGQAAQQLLGTQRPRRRRPCRGPHVHLLGRSCRCRADQQLARRSGDASRADFAVQRGDARSHDVRGAVQHGPARLAHRPHRRATHRQRLRGGQHADHDPHGTSGARHPRRRRVGAVRPLRRGPAGTRRDRQRVAVQSRQQVHRPLPRVPRDLVVRLGLRRQRPARQEVLRTAHRLGDGPRRRLAGRAHVDPQAHQPGGRVEVHRRRLSRRPAARPTSPCCSRRSPAGPPRPSATTSAG